MCKKISSEISYSEKKISELHKVSIRNIAKYYVSVYFSWNTSSSSQVKQHFNGKPWFSYTDVIFIHSLKEGSTNPSPYLKYIDFIESRLVNLGRAVDDDGTSVYVLYFTGYVQVT